MIGLELLMATHLLVKASAGVSEPPAAIQSCPPQKAPIVDVRWRSEALKFDFSKNFADLGGKPIDSSNVYGKNVAVDIWGLMSGKIESTPEVSISSASFPATQTTCLWVDKVIVSILVDPTIEIAREYPQGTCEFDAILEHENKHVLTDQNLVKAYLDQIRMAASDAVQKVGIVGPKPDARAENYKIKMNDYVVGQISAVMDDLYAKRVVLQKGLDTKEEYQRIRKKCPQAEKPAPVTPEIPPLRAPDKVPPH